MIIRDLKLFLVDHLLRQNGMLTEAHMSALVGFLGTLVGAAITLLASKRNERLKETFGFHKEFNSKEMSNARSLAFKLLEKHPNERFDVLSKNLSAEETSHLWLITSFYQRLWIAIKHKQLVNKIVPELFGELAVWWYYFSFKERFIPVGWESARDFKNLIDWLWENSKPEDWGRWKNRSHSNSNQLYINNMNDKQVSFFARKKRKIKNMLSRPFILSNKPEVLLLVFSLLILVVTFIVAYTITEFKEFGKALFPSNVSQAYIVESLKILGAALFAGVVALLVTNVWQQKSVGFEMLKELNSPEFFIVRNVLSAQKKISKIDTIDIDNMRLWFPGNKNAGREIKFYTKEQFSHAHALPSMIYFVVRLANYGRHGMLNIRVTKNLFNVFFVHYQIVLLEFAAAFEKHYETEYKLGDYLSYTEIENEMWLQRIRDIRYFFRIIGLDDNLDSLAKNGNYVYEFFPSMNGPLPEDKANKYATEVDLNQYIKDNS